LASTDLSMLREAIDTIASGGEVTAEQSVYLDALAEQWPELEAAAKKGSDAYVKALREVEKEIASTQIHKILEDQEINKKIKMDLDTTDAQKQISDFMDKDYSITIEVQTVLDNAFNDAVASAEEFNSLAALIGDNYILAGEDIAKVGAAFP
jgi:hypothetical protein